MAQVLSLDGNRAEPNRAASSCADRSLKLGDLQHKRCVRDFVAVRKTCNSLRFSTDGQARLLTSCHRSLQYSSSPPSQPMCACTCKLCCIA